MTRFAQLDRAVRAAKLLTSIRQKDPELWAKIKAFVEKQERKAA